MADTPVGPQAPSDPAMVQGVKNAQTQRAPHQLAKDRLVKPDRSSVAGKLVRKVLNYYEHSAPLLPEAGGFKCFKGNDHPPRAPLWDIGGDLFTYKSYVSSMLWDLKEVGFFALTFMFWINERYASVEFANSETSSVKGSDAFNYILAALCSFFVITVAVSTYLEMQRRKRLYYIYLLIDVLIDFDNVQYYQKKRFGVVLVFASFLYYLGIDESDIFSWHNLDGLINLYGLVYFVSAEMELEQHLVPFSKIFEREDGRDLITAGWTELTLVTEDVIVAYCLIRAAQVKEVNKQISADRKAAKLKHIPIRPKWQASRPDLQEFAEEQFVPSEVDPELLGALTDAERMELADAMEASCWPGLARCTYAFVMMWKRIKVAVARFYDEVTDFKKEEYDDEHPQPTAHTIPGYWWRKHWYGYIVGLLVADQNCVFGPFENLKKETSFFLNLRDRKGDHDELTKLARAVSWRVHTKRAQLQASAVIGDPEEVELREVEDEKAVDGGPDDEPPKATEERSDDIVDQVQQPIQVLIQQTVEEEEPPPTIRRVSTDHMWAPKNVRRKRGRKKAAKSRVPTARGRATRSGKPKRSGRSKAGRV